jgi:hypothetical protein
VTSSSRLVDQVGTSAGKAATGPVAGGSERRLDHGDAGPVNGVEIDGQVYQLQGQPPVATCGGWWPPH